MSGERTEFRLVVPEGWVVEELVRARLDRQLERAPSRIAGVAAETGELPPGASYRVHAEWKMLEPLSAARESSTGTVRGAVLLRGGVDFDARDGVVDVSTGALLVDHGAHVHDPWRPVGPVEVASELARSPFPRRPVVVLLGIDPDLRLAEFARRLVNGMVRRDVEGRLALPAVSEGLHLTRACAPSEDSLRALAPDVVVTLDEHAAEHAPSWCGGRRSTVIVALDVDLTEPVRLVSWQVGRASGRLRARIGRRVDAATLVGLVYRLCAGPQPVPPSDIVEPLPDRVRRRTPVDARTCAVLAGALDRGAALRTNGLVDHLPTTGISTELTTTKHRRLPPHARTADLVVLVGAHDPDAVEELIEARSADGRPTVVDLAPGDLDHESMQMDTAVLTASAAHIVAMCRLASSPNGALHAALRNAGVRGYILPTVLTRARAAALRDARLVTAASPPPSLVVGWHVEEPGWPRCRYVDAVAEGLSKVLADLLEVEVEIVSGTARVPGPLQGNDRVKVVDPDPEQQQLARWSLHLWTPWMVREGVADDLRHWIEASYAGVPTVGPVRALEAVDRCMSPDVTVTDVREPEEWGAALGALLGDEHLRAHRAAEVQRRSSTLDGPAASKAAVSRFVGCALHQPVT